jgi:hypothetical protein
MAFSQVGITNLALTRIGAATVATMTENVFAKTANALWEYLRNEVLEAANWTFAMKRAILVQDATAPVFGYDYRYAKPADSIRIVSLSYKGSDKVPFVVEGDYILTDQDNTDEDLYALYLWPVTDPAKYSAHFARALGLRLAADLAVKVQQASGLKNEIMQEYEQFLSRAEGVDRSQDYLEDEKGSTSWQDAGR